MNRPLLGLMLGAVIGLFDGSTAYVSAPELRDQIITIVLGSSFKGLIGGLVTGFVVNRTRSHALGITVGLIVAAALAAIVAHVNATHYEDPSMYWKIILPGATMGAIVGYATVRFGRPKCATESVA